MKGNNYMNNMYNFEFQNEEDLNFVPDENNEEISNRENSDNLLKNMEVTLNTFLNNLKSDDVPNMPNFNPTRNKNVSNFSKNQKNYKTPKQNFNKYTNFYNPQTNLIQSYQSNVIF